MNLANDSYFLLENELKKVKIQLLKDQNQNKILILVINILIKIIYLKKILMN